MEISKHIIEEAKRTLQGGGQLPRLLTKSSQFYVAESSDTSIHAFASIEHDGVIYKIGTKSLLSKHQ